MKIPRAKKWKSNKEGRHGPTLPKPGKPWEAVKMNMYYVPFDFPQDLTKAERINHIREIGQRAKSTFNRIFSELDKWFKEYDPLYLLSFCSYYFMVQKEGIDSEATGEMKFFHYHLEILQALSLYHPRNSSAKPLLGEADKLYTEIIELGKVIPLRLLAIPDELTTDEEISMHRLRTEMMMQTTAVRNWAYPHQMAQIISDLLTLIETEFTNIYGVSPVMIYEVLVNLTENINTKLNDHRNRVIKFTSRKNYKDVVKVYNEYFQKTTPITNEEADIIWRHSGNNIITFISWLMLHSDLKLELIYTFNLNEYVKDINDRNLVHGIISKISYNFEDLKDYPMEYILLGNPILRRPFINVNGGNFFTSLYGIMSHMALDIFEYLIWDNQNLMNKYVDVKAKYLEDKIEILFKESFPNANIYSGIEWLEEKSNKVRENDLIVIIENFALIIEAKSGIVTDPAKRAAPERLIKTLKELIEVPSEQANRFIDYLKLNKRIHSFNTKGNIRFQVDSSRINYYIPLGITLAHLGLISGNLNKLIDAKVVNKDINSLAPSISITDLESVFELLPSEAEKIHYLYRRREIERHLQYEGDELDLLAFYLETGFNIGESEYDRTIALSLSPKSKELDPYFVGSRLGKKVKKPELAMTKWWKTLLNVITTKKLDGWMEVCQILLNVGIHEQKIFESRFKQLSAKIRKGKTDKPENWLKFTVGPERRQYIIFGYPYTMQDKEVRNIVLNSIMEDPDINKVNGALLIGININQRDFPYSVILRSSTILLFDNFSE